MSKWYLNELDILEYEENEVVSNNLIENDEDGIKNLKKINRLKKYGREAKEIWKRWWINDKTKRRKKCDKLSAILKTNLKFIKTLFQLWFLLYGT